MRTIFFICLSFLLVSCKRDLGTNENSKDLSCNIDIEFVSNYLNDISRIIAIQKSAEDYAFDSFRRLEGITKNEFNIDYLGSHFATNNTNVDTLSQKVIGWITWMEDNKCDFTIDMANQVFKKANNSVRLPDFKEDDYISKLRIKQPNYELLSDSLIIELEKQKLENGKLKIYPIK